MDDLRNCRTLPEARTGVLLCAQARIVHVAVSSLLIAFVDEAGIVTIHTKLHGVQCRSQVKQRIPVVNSVVESPLTSVETNAGVNGLSFSRCESLLFVFSQKGIGCIDLTLFDLRPNWFETYPCSHGVVWGDQKIVVSNAGGPPVVCEWIRNDLVTITKSYPLFSASDVRKFGKEWRHIASDPESGQLAMVCDNTVVTSTKQIISLSSIEVLSIHVTNKAIIVHQLDSVSVFDLHGDLSFVMRDIINKTKYISVDVVDSFLITLFETSKKIFLEFSQITHPDVDPLLRWDVTRIGSEESIVRFSKDSLSFMTTFIGKANSGALVWDSVMADHWFSVMPNFKVLPQNEPYEETEDEFDFNQNEPDSVVRATINRYKTLSTPEFDFVPSHLGGISSDSCLEEPPIAPIPQSLPVYPFMQPLDAWKHKPTELVRHKINNKSVVFFGEGRI